MPKESANKNKGVGGYHPWDSYRRSCPLSINTQRISKFMIQLVGFFLKQLKAKNKFWNERRRNKELSIHPPSPHDSFSIWLLRVLNTHHTSTYTQTLTNALPPDSFPLQILHILQSPILVPLPPWNPHKSSNPCDLSSSKYYSNLLLSHT